MAGKSIFLRTVKSDFKLGLKLRLLLAVCGVALGFCFDNWEDLRSFAFRSQTGEGAPTVCVLYYFFNSFSFGGVFSEYFAAIMAAIPFAANYCDEADGGMVPYKIARCGKKAYAQSKFLVSSILGGTAFTLGSLIFILILAVRLPLVTPDQIIETSWLPFSQALTVGNGALYFAIVLCICFLGGALWGSVGLCVSAFFPNCYVAVCAPFVLRFLLVQVNLLLRMPDILRLDLLLSARQIIYSDTVTFLITASYVLLLILLCYRLFCIRLERSVWNAEKIRSVFLFQAKQIRTNYRILMIFILISLFICSNLQGVLDFSKEVGIRVTAWAFPHITSDFVCQLVIMVGAVALFCDAPFESEIQNYILPRAGYTAWAAGQCMYIIVLSFLYVLVILLFTFLPLFPNLTFQDGWGKIWGTLARVGGRSKYGIPFMIYDYLIGAYTPQLATALSFLLTFECCVWLGLLTYFFNYLSGGYTGTFLAAGFVLMDITVANEWLPWFYRISPVTLAQLQALRGKDSLYQVNLSYALWFFGISIICLLVGCIVAPKFCSFRRKRK